MARPYQRSDEFVEDMYALKSAGYLYKQDYADRLGITLSCFDRRLCRARAKGLLPKGEIGSVFYPFGKATWRS